MFGAVLYAFIVGSLCGLFSVLVGVLLFCAVVCCVWVWFACGCRVCLLCWLAVVCALALLGIAFVMHWLFSVLAFGFSLSLVVGACLLSPVFSVLTYGAVSVLRCVLFQFLVYVA